METNEGRDHQEDLDYSRLMRTNHGGIASDTDAVDTARVWREPGVFWGGAWKLHRCPCFR